jgi:hypothetical protein
MKKTVLTVAALFAAMPAFAQMAMTDLDANADSMLDETEFGTTDVSASYGGYDADGDGSITQDEFRAGEFRRYDADRDGMLNEEEYGAYDADRMMMDQSD